MSDNDNDKIFEAINLLEQYFFGEAGKDRGEQLFLEFATKYKNFFINSKLNNSTENKFQ